MVPIDTRGVGFTEQILIKCVTLDTMVALAKGRSSYHIFDDGLHNDDDDDDFISRTSETVSSCVRALAAEEAPA